MSAVLFRFGGAEVRRVIDRSGATVPEHAHDWPVLSVFVMGGYRNTTELGTIPVAGPSALLYEAGAAHANQAGPEGFEQIEIEFDPRWLGHGREPREPVSRWLAGSAASAARRLARTLIAGPAESQLRTAMRGFFDGASAETRPSPPSWLGVVDEMVREDPGVRIQDLARRIDRHPAWLGVAYARHHGEGLQATMARRRVEHAARLLRETDEPPASVAADAGFCDQSHMHRVFRRVLARTPADVRADRAIMRRSDRP